MQVIAIRKLSTFYLFLANVLTYYNALTLGIVATCSAYVNYSQQTHCEQLKGDILLSLLDNHSRRLLRRYNLTEQLSQWRHHFDQPQEHTKVLPQHQHQLLLKLLFKLLLFANKLSAAQSAVATTSCLNSFKLVG